MARCEEELARDETDRGAKALAEAISKRLVSSFIIIFILKSLAAEKNLSFFVCHLILHTDE